MDFHIAFTLSACFELGFSTGRKRVVINPNACSDEVGRPNGAAVSAEPFSSRSRHETRIGPTAHIDAYVAPSRNVSKLLMVYLGEEEKGGEEREFYLKRKGNFMYKNIDYLDMETHKVIQLLRP